MVETARAQLLDQSRQAFTRALAPVTAPQWVWQTGCAGWTVGDLVTHVIGTIMMYAALLGGATAAEAMSELASATTTPATAISDWDLSTATHQDAIIGFDLAQAIYDEMAPDAERLRRLGAFRPAIPVPADAPSADRLVALLGRAVSPHSAQRPAGS
jgi:hypothetical protein